MATIRLQGLTKRFGRHTAVQDLDLEIRDGEFFILLGPTGAGKTTTLRCLAGLEAPDAGRIVLGERDVTGWSAAERDVALVFQYYSLYPHFTVRQNLEFPLRSPIREVAPEERARRIAQVAETLRITHLLDRKTDRLSGGEMQRVSIGRAIVRNPQVFLMDEPLSNLDAKLREILRAELKSLQMNLGATFLYVTHDQVEAMTMADRIGILLDGRLVQVGTPYEIYNRPCNVFVAGFVGSPGINLLDARLHGNGLHVVAADCDIALERRPPDGDGPVQVGVRSEDVQLGTDSPLRGRVYGVENYGMEKVVSLKLGPVLVRATVPATTPVAIDEQLPISFRPGSLHLFRADNGARLEDAPAA